MVGTIAPAAWIFFGRAGYHQAAGLTHPPEMKGHQNKKTGGNDHCVNGKENR